MLNRLRNFLKLSKLPPKFLSELLDADQENVDRFMETLAEAHRLANHPILYSDMTFAQAKNVETDGKLEIFKAVTGLTDVVRAEPKGEFLPDMTDDEVLKYEHDERGWKNFKLPWQKH